jgi:group I intron endonuclease
MINITSKVPIIGIYKITSPSGKIYIGQSINIVIRWKKYEILDCKTQIKLYRSLKKYGYENHIFEIVEECFENHLNEREIYWGEYFNVLKENGLVLRLGKSRGRWSEEIKQKMRKPKSEETKQKMRKPKSKSFPKSEEYKIKMSKPLLQYDLEGNFIKEWSSGTQVKQILKIHSSNIPACCQGKKKTVGGYIWRYKEN